MNQHGDVKVERRGRVALLTLSRPQKHNTLTRHMRGALAEALTQLAADDGIGALVLRGDGPVAFCAGMDVTEFKGRPGVEQWRSDVDPSRIYEVMERFPKPLIAMIDGYAFGGGCELALACDIRICSERSQLGQLEINFGLIPGGGGTQRLARLTGRGQAMRLILSGDKISGAEAYRIGLVELLAPDEQLLPMTLALADRIAAHDPLPLELAKASIVSAEELPLSAGLRYEASLMAIGLAEGRQEHHIDAFAPGRRSRATPSSSSEQDMP
jgi:enoyl-CoA hydratase